MATSSVVWLLAGVVLGALLALGSVRLLHKKGKSVPGVPPPLPTLEGRWVFDGSKHVHVRD